MAQELDKVYSPQQVEEQAYARWLEKGHFHATPASDGSGNKGPYGIVIPPPNVTGALHMGHALNNTIQDVLIRWRRMRGYNVMWMPGTDHAGIATQTVVEKRVLAEEGKRRTDFSREVFIEKIQAWKQEYEGRITHQLQAMGCSCDWQRQRFTMDPVCAQAVREAFFRLFKDGLIYRGKRLVNWDPLTQTALADDEVEMQEIDGHFWYLKYPLTENVEIDGQMVGHVTVATTRPETMLGDTAVAMNPADPRAAALRDKWVKLPIVGRDIPIIEDDYVVLPDTEGDDPKARFATGFLKVTPAHDPNDWEIGQRHELDIINVMAPDGSISTDHGWKEQEENIHEAANFLGMDRFEAREAIVIWFRNNNLLEEVKPYTHTVGHSYRSHVPIEPYLSDQWYVKVTDERLAGAALRAMKPELRGASDGCAWTDNHPFNTSHRDQKETIEASRDRKQAVEPNRDTPHDVHSTSPDREGGGISRKSLTSVTKSQTRVFDYFFLTFTTYGTWPHGDGRGSVDRKNNQPGEPYLSTNESLEHYEDSQLQGDPVVFNRPQRATVRDTILEVCQHRDWRLHACNVRTNHVHVVVLADESPEKILNSFKSYATRRLRESNYIDQDQTVWTRHGSTRYINSADSLKAACAYVLQEQGTDLGGVAQEQEEPILHESESMTYVSQKERYAGHFLDGRLDGPLPHGRGSLNVNEGKNWEGGLTFYPERYAKTFQTWHENIRDWCISRQLWWGHRIPVWALDRSKYKNPSDKNIVDELCQKYATDIEIRSRVSTESNEPEQRLYLCLRKDIPEVRREIERIGFEQDPDVLDTWFSSALWPMSTLGWPSPTDFPDDFPEGDGALSTWNPSDTLCTAREIITLWVSRMVMFNVYFRDCLPFKDVFIHAMIQDGEGQKMSKSLGNGVDPLDIIHSHGADAMRFTLAWMTTLTQDVRMPVDMVCPHSGETFSPKMIKNKAGYRVAAPIQACPTDKNKKMATSYGVVSGEVRPTEEIPLARNTSSKFDVGRNFSNKLWNACRFALLNFEEGSQTNRARQQAGTKVSVDGDVPLPDGRGSLSASSLRWEDRWILSRLSRTCRSVTEHLAAYRFSDPVQELYKFFWNDLCDWYLEMLKPRMSSEQDRPAAQAVLAYVLDSTLRLLHPFIPFITEQLYRQLHAMRPQRQINGLPALEPADDLIVAIWPELGDALAPAQVDDEMELIQSVVRAVRDVRSRYNVPPRERIPVSIKAAEQASVLLNKQGHIVRHLAGVSELAAGEDIDKPANAAVAVEQQLEIYVHDVVDAEAEKQRLIKQREEVTGVIAVAEKKLGNENFVNRAKPEIVQRERDRLVQLQEQLATIENNLADLN